MNDEQKTTQLIENTKAISALSESLRSAHKRIDDNDRVTEGIHKLASNVENLALQFKHIAERMESRFSALEASSKRQGERIGELEKKPGKRWESLVSQIITLAVAGVMGWVLAQVFGG